jgi:hypothetical protein
MGNEVTKGVIALREHLNRPIMVKENGDTFYFKKLTMGAEEEIDKIILAHQDTSLKPPADLTAESTEQEIEQYNKDVVDYTNRVQKALRHLTCALMKYMQTDEKGNPLFAQEDDLYDLVNNVYAQNFFNAYTKFRNGRIGGVAEAEKRFQN